MPNPHYIAKKAEADGKIVRPDFCEICNGGVKSKLVKHHPDYSKPSEVKWLCIPCHIKLHKSGDGPKNPHNNRKPIQVSARTHEIIRREAFSQSLESDLGTGDIYMHDVIAKFAEEIQTKRNYLDLPEVVG